MPNFLAHHLFAKDLFQLKNQDLKYEDRSFLKNNFFYLTWGSQGPDPLFYNGLNFRNGFHLITALKKTGNKLHKDNFEKLLSIMCEKYNTIKEFKTDAIKSFIVGQFAHYMLDSYTHPFILYKSGFNEEGRIKGKYHYAHAHYEMLIDASLAESRNMGFFKNYPYYYLLNDDKKFDIINKFMYEVLKAYFKDIKIYQKIYKSGAKNMCSFIKFVNTGSKARTFIFTNTSLSAMRVTKKKVEKDVLNLKNGAWLDPTTGKEEKTSFIDLYNETFKNVVELYDVIKDKDDLQVEYFKKYLNGLDYYGKNKDSKLTYCEERKK